MTSNGATSSKPGSLNKEQLCKTTGWYNNCGLNSLTHFMYAKLSAIPAELFPNFLEHNPEYTVLLETFKQYYNLNKAISWQDVLKLLRDHPVPTDREAIFAPVLRAHLGKVIAENPAASWEHDAVGAISDYIKNGKVVDVAVPFYTSNSQFFDSLRVEYHYALNKSLQTNASEAEIEQATKRLVDKHKNITNKNRVENYVPTGFDILTNVIEQRKIQLENEYCEVFQKNWVNEGCRRYATFVANMNNQVMVTAPHLTHLCEALNIGTEVYSPAGLASRSEGQFEWLLRAYVSGLHWTFEEPNNNQAAVVQHNRHYEDGRTLEMLGKYKIHTGQPTSKEMIIASVRCALGVITETELQELKEVEQVTQQLAQASLKALEATTLKPAVKKIFEASKEGKEYLELIMANKDLLKVVNEQYNDSLAQVFIAECGALVQKVKALSTDAKKVAFFEGYVKKKVTEAVDSVAAVLKPQAPAIVVENKSGIKLAYLAILQQDPSATQMVQRIQKDLAAVAIVNGFSEFGVRAFVDFCNQPDDKHGVKILGLLKLDQAKMLNLLQKLQVMFDKAETEAKLKADGAKVKPNL